jgi:hypothetical protein
MRSCSPEERRPGRSSYPEKTASRSRYPVSPWVGGRSADRRSHRGVTRQEPKPLGKDDNSFRVGVSETALRSGWRSVSPHVLIGSPDQRDSMTRPDYSGEQERLETGNANASLSCPEGASKRGIGNGRAGKREQWDTGNRKRYVGERRTQNHLNPLKRFRRSKL